MIAMNHNTGVSYGIPPITCEIHPSKSYYYKITYYDLHTMDLYDYAGVVSNYNCKIFYVLYNTKNYYTIFVLLILMLCQSRDM